MKKKYFKIYFLTVFIILLLVLLYNKQAVSPAISRTLRTDRLCSFPFPYRAELALGLPG